MKKMGVGVAALICLGVFIVFGILAAVTVNSFGGFEGIRWKNSSWFSIKGLNQKSYSVDQTVSFSADEISDVNTISISSISADITVKSGNELVAHLYGDYRSASEIELVPNKANGNLEIKVQVPSRSLSMTNLKLDITLPESYVKELSLASVSGTIKMDIPEKELTALNLASTSGNLKCDITSCDLNASTISGSVKCTIKEGNMNVSSTSGSLKATTGAGDINASTVSGSITLRSDQFKSIDANSTSGSLNITVSKGSSFKVVFDSVSGSFNSVMPLSVTSNKKRHFEGIFGDGESSINAHSVSGSCQINYE